MGTSFEISVILDDIEKNLVIRLISDSHRPSSGLMSKSINFLRSRACQYC